MNTKSPPNHPSAADQLPADIYDYVVRTLRLTLPPPLSDSPEDRARRDGAVIAWIAALCPANLAEAVAAVQHVVASEYSMECLRQASHPELSLPGALRCRAEASSLMRRAQSALRLLLRMQAARQKTEATPEARDSAARNKERAVTLLRGALSSKLVLPPWPVPSLPKSEPQPAEQPAPDPVTAAEPDTAMYPLSDAVIRPMGLVPDNDVLQALNDAGAPGSSKLNGQATQAPPPGPASKLH